MDLGNGVVMFETNRNKLVLPNAKTAEELLNTLRRTPRKLWDFVAEDAKYVIVECCVWNMDKQVLADLLSLIASNNSNNMISVFFSRNYTMSSVLCALAPHSFIRAIVVKGSDLQGLDMVLDRLVILLPTKDMRMSPFLRNILDRNRETFKDVVDVMTEYENQTQPKPKTLQLKSAISDLYERVAYVVWVWVIILIGLLFSLGLGLGYYRILTK